MRSTTLTVQMEVSQTLQTYWEYIETGYVGIDGARNNVNRNLDF